MTKTQAISEQLLVAVAETGSVQAAFDKVFGEGAYEKFAGELYDELRARN